MVKRKRLSCKDILKIKKAKSTKKYNKAVVEAEFKLGRKLTIKDLARSCKRRIR